MIILFAFVGCSLYEAAEHQFESQKHGSTMGLLISEVILTIAVFVVITIWARDYVKDSFEEIEREDDEDYQS